MTITRPEIDPSVTTWVDTTNLAPDTYYYPDVNGRPLDTLDQLTMQVVLEDASLVVEASLGTRWVPVTKSVTDLCQGQAWYSIFTSADGVTTDFILDMDGSNVKVRCAVTTPNATNRVTILAIARNR